MKYRKPEAAVIDFEAVSVILSSTPVVTETSVETEEGDDRLPDTPTPLNFYD